MNEKQRVHTAEKHGLATHNLEPAKTRCPRCESRLDVFETPSGGRTVSVAFLGLTVEMTAAALELFIPRDRGAEIQCPACKCSFDPSGPVRRIPGLK